MKKISILLCVLSSLINLTACEIFNTNELQPSYTDDQAASESTVSDQPDTSSRSDELSQTETQTSDEMEDPEYMLNIQIGENTLTATLEQNSSAEALLNLLSDGPITIDMSDYANMEKVGTLPESLPRNDEAINTDACDLILYQGSSFVIYYDTNSWSLTRLGKIDNITKSELKDILGTGDVTVVLSLPSQS